MAELGNAAAQPGREGNGVPVTRPALPLSARFIWLQATRESRRERYPNLSLFELSTKAAEEWKALEDKTEWYEAAEVSMLQYHEALAAYNAAMMNAGVGDFQIEDLDQPEIYLDDDDEENGGDGSDDGEEYQVESEEEDEEQGQEDMDERYHPLAFTLWLHESGTLDELRENYPDDSAYQLDWKARARWLNMELEDKMVWLNAAQMGYDVAARMAALANPDQE